MEHRPAWESSSFSSSREIYDILWNAKVYYCIHKSPPPVPVLSQTTPYPHPISWRAILILSLPLLLGLPSDSSLRFTHQNTVYTSSYPLKCHLPPPPSHPGHLVLDVITIMIIGKECKSWSSLTVQSSPVFCILLPLRPKCLPQHAILSMLLPHVTEHKNKT